MPYFLQNRFARGELSDRMSEVAGTEVYVLAPAIEADGGSWPEGFVIVNAMSRNAGLRWSLEEARRWLQWEPRDGIPEPA